MPQIYRRTHIQKKGFNKVAKQLLQERLFSKNTYGGAAFKYTKLVCWNKQNLFQGDTNQYIMNKNLIRDHPFNTDANFPEN